MKRSIFSLLLSILFSFSDSVWAQNDVQVLGDAVLTPEEIADGASVMYMIRFQNTGEDTAYQVVIYDTLDARLDPFSVHINDSSHGYAYFHDGNNNLRWYFEEINLPSSHVNFQDSYGFVLFSVKPRPFVEPGQVVTNRACISFDPNEHICTNETAFWIDQEATSVDHISKENKFRVVPNPNFGQFLVQPSENNSGSAAWWVTDMTGKTVWDGSASDVAYVSQEVMLEKPSPGLYLLWVKSEEKVEVQQFAVIK